MRSLLLGTVLLLSATAFGKIEVPEVLRGEFITEKKDMSFVVGQNGANERSSVLISHFIKTEQEKIYYSYGAREASHVPYEVESELSESVDGKSASLDITVRVGRWKNPLYLNYSWRKIKLIFNKEDSSYRLKYLDGGTTALLIAGAVSWSNSTSVKLHRVVREESPDKISGISAEGIDFGSTNVVGTLPIPASLNESVDFAVKFDGLSAATIKGVATGIIEDNGRQYLVPVDFSNVEAGEVIFKIPKQWAAARKSNYTFGSVLKIFAGKFGVFSISLANLRGEDEQIKPLVVRLIPSLPVSMSYVDKESKEAYSSLAKYSEAKFGAGEVVRGFSDISVRLYINGFLLLSGSNRGFISTNDQDTDRTAAQFKVTYISDEQSRSDNSVLFSTSNLAKVPELLNGATLTTRPVFIASRQEIKEVKAKVSTPVMIVPAEEKTVSGYIWASGEVSGDSLETVFSALKAGVTLQGRIQRPK